MTSSTMSKLWDLATSSPSPSIVAARATPFPPCSGTRVAQRGDQVWMRQKELGIWRSWTWRADRRGRARDRRRPAGARASRRGDALHPVQHRHRMGAGRPGRAVSCGGVSNGIYPTDAAAQVQYLCEDSRTTHAVRRGRRAAGQGAGSARAAAACCARSSCSTWKACATCDDPGVMSLDELRALGREYIAQHPDALDAARRAPCSPKTWRSWSTPPAPPASPRARCIQPPRAGLHRARLQHADRAGRARRAHVLPAAVPHRRAHGRRVLLAVHRREAQLRREPRDGAGERARDRAHRVHRRAARVGEVLFRRDDRR